MELDEAGLRRQITEFLASHDPATMDRLEFLRARYDAGLAWIHFPEGHGGQGLPRFWQPGVDEQFAAAGAPDNAPKGNVIGLGMAAPTILAFGTEEQKRRFLRPLWTGEEIWCQLFSEPGAGSDLAGLATTAVRDGDEWIVNGQKVWTTRAQMAQFAILLARTDSSLPKHRGLTYFLCDMRVSGIDIRPLRQITGEGEFNEVFLSEVRVPDSHRLGDVGQGWAAATATLNNERVAIGGKAGSREAGMAGAVARTWREHPERHTPETHQRLLRLWVEAEVARLTGERVRQKLVQGQPGSEGAALKIVFARVNQELSGLELELLADEGLRYADWFSDWADSLPALSDLYGHDAGFRYLRAKGNSIEGGTSEILRNIVAERTLGLPSEPRVDKDIPWKDVAK